MKTEYVSLSALNYDREELLDLKTPVFVNFEKLPQTIEFDKIGVNISLMRRIGEVARLRCQIWGSHHQDNKRVEPTVVGVDGNGTALGGFRASKTNKNDVFTALGDEPGRTAFEMSKAYSTIPYISLDGQTFGERLSDKSRQNDTTESAVPIFDDMLRQGYREVLDKHLMKRAHALDRLTNLIAVTTHGTILSHSAVTNNVDTGVFVGGVVATMWALSIGADRLVTGDWQSTVNRRLDIIPAGTFQPVRYALAQTALASSDIVRYMPELAQSKNTR